MNNLNNFEENHRGIASTLFYDIHHFIVAVSPQGNMFFTTQKCGQSFLRSFCKTAHFEVCMLNDELKRDQEKKYLIHKNYLFKPFDEVDVSHLEIFEEAGVSSITELLQFPSKIIIRHPWERFISGLLFLGKQGIKDNLDIESVSLEEYNKHIDEYWDEVLRNPDGFQFTDPHLRPWLSFIEDIKTNKSKVILLDDLSKETEEDRKSYSGGALQYNSTKKLQDRKLDKHGLPYLNLAILYKEIFINEYKSWINLTNGRGQNS